MACRSRHGVVLVRGMMNMWRWINRGAVALMALVCVVALGALSAALVAGHAGYRTEMMETSSMSPLIKPGDVVLVRPVAPATIHAGDVVTFHEPLGDHLLVTHRVIAVTPSRFGPAFHTRGDANKVADP